MKIVSRYAKQYRLEILLAPLFKLCEACLELFVPLIIAYLVDVIIPKGNQGDLVAVLFLLVGMAVLGVLVSLIAQYFAAKVAVGMTRAMTFDVYSHILSLSHSSRRAFSSATLLTRITSDTLRIQNGINIFLRLFLRAPIVVTGSFVMAVYLQPKLSLYFLGMVVLLFLTIFLISRISNRFYVEMRVSLEQLIQHVKETVAGWRVIRAFCQEESEVSYFQDLNEVYRSQQIQAAYWSTVLTPATFLLVNGTMLFLVWEGHIAILDNVIEQGVLVALLNYLSQILVELLKLVMVFSTLHQTSISLTRIQSILDQEVENTESLFGKQDSRDYALIYSIQNLSFIHPSATAPVLEMISFDVTRGQFIGIIGGIGSGKSTLVELLLALYPPSKGTIGLFKDGKHVSHLREWRKQIAYVSQEIQLFSGTIRSNVTLGLENVSDEEIWSVLTVAQAETFVRERGGLDSEVHMFGKNFSGGQRQRLAIARALLQHAPILIMDDATSALDSLTERELLTALRQAFPEQTLIMVSQRFHSFYQADSILVLENGKQAGFGSHFDLLQTSSVYQEIVQSQKMIGGIR